MSDRQNPQIHPDTGHKPVAGQTVSDTTMTFWDHLDVLRNVLLRMAVVIIACSIAAFCFKDILFAFILAPKNDSFVIYSLLNQLSELLGGTPAEHFTVQLINTGLAEQFKIHVKAALYAGLLIASPYCLCLLFRFIAPALYNRERYYTLRATIVGYTMFLIGAALCYFLIFPLTVRFLGTYQVSTDVENMITLQSYIDTLIIMTFLMGILFELPVVCWVLSRLGILSASFMRRYRKHAIVVILIIAAIITPTSDAFTLCLVALPICLLYEISILVVRSKG